MPYVIGLDPGTSESAICCWDGTTVLDHYFIANEEVIGLLSRWREIYNVFPPTLVIEKIASQGMAVGATTFETCFWTGRFAQAYGIKYTERITRGEVKMHLCGSMRAKDGNVRMALIDRFGPPGTKKQKGILYGITSHKLAALAVAVTYYDLHKESK